jgi:hypothetical protein
MVSIKSKTIYKLKKQLDEISFKIFFFGNFKK